MMRTEELKNLVQQYFDGELEKNKEPLMFTLLAEDLDARELFKELSLLKSTIEETYEDVPFKLEEAILKSAGTLYSTKPKSKINERLYTVFAYSVAAVLLIFSLILFNQINSYKDKVESINQQVKAQNQTIEMLYNSLPAMEVKAKWDNEIVIKANL